MGHYGSSVAFMLSLKMLISIAPKSSICAAVGRCCSTHGTSDPQQIGSFSSSSRWSEGTVRSSVNNWAGQDFGISNLLTKSVLVKIMIRQY